MNADGIILYVGKARSLHDRVQQYLVASRLDSSKRALMRHAADVHVVVTKNEAEALALEATLIQKHTPPYNIRLVDDSSYLYVRISRETYPRVALVRRVAPDGAWYRGPFPTASAIRTTMREARKLFPWCEYSGQMPVAGRRVPATGNRQPVTGNRRSCFAYHLGRCPGICAGAVSLEEYQQILEGLKRFLDGDTAATRQTLRNQMTEASSRQSYERAARLRDALAAIERATAPQHVATPKRVSVDVCGVARRGVHAVVTLLAVRDGRVTDARTFPLLVPPDEPEAMILRGFLVQYLHRVADGPRTLLLPESVEDSTLLESGIVHYSSSPEAPRRRRKVPRPGALRLIVPQRGWKRRLLELARTNAAETLARMSTESSSPAALTTALKNLATALRLPHLPRRIEAYDISNIQGTLPTASMVVFVDGKPKRSAYRKFKIAFGETPHDVAMMREVLRRRFTRHAESKEQGAWPLPDLVLLDGGKGQLNAGTAVLQELQLDLPLAALAKREEELFLPGRTQPVALNRTSPALFLLQRVRDEAHRFTLAYHQLLRKKRMTKSALEDIPGVGDATRKKLLRTFGSLRAIRAASRDDLAHVVGSKLAGEITTFFLKPSVAHDSAAGDRS